MAVKPWQAYQGLYLHVPFCRRRCLYCDFVSSASWDRQLQRAYVQALCREVELAHREEDDFALPLAAGASIYLGGGTPSLLASEDLEQLVNALTRAGYWRQPREATIEVNPGTVDYRYLAALRRLGFDRLSVGVQSLQDGELAALGRSHTAAQAVAALQQARQAGFARLSADVMYSIPRQSPASLASTLQQLAELGVDHVSAYCLSLEEGTPLARMVAEGRVELPGEEAEEELYYLVQTLLREAGYQRYEVSNYARPGQASLHNQVYWHYLPYLAFGVAACGFNGRRRRTGCQDIQAYLALLQGAEALPQALYQYEELSLATQVEEYLLLGLRLTAGVDLAEAQERFGLVVEEGYRQVIDAYSRLGLLSYQQEGRRLALTEEGMAVGNQVWSAFTAGPEA